MGGMQYSILLPVLLMSLGVGAPAGAEPYAAAVTRAGAASAQARFADDGRPDQPLRRVQPLLRFYASLTPAQRVQLDQGGIRFRELTLVQADRLSAWRPSAGGGADARISLRHEPDAVVFRLDADASTPREERVKLGRKGPRSRI